MPVIVTASPALFVADPIGAQILHLLESLLSYPGLVASTIKAHLPSCLVGILVLSAQRFLPPAAAAASAPLLAPAAVAASLLGSSSGAPSAATPSSAATLSAAAAASGAPGAETPKKGGGKPAAPSSAPSPATAQLPLRSMGTSSGGSSGSSAPVAAAAAASRRAHSAETYIELDRSVTFLLSTLCEQQAAIDDLTTGDALQMLFRCVRPRRHRDSFAVPALAQPLLIHVSVSCVIDCLRVGMPPSAHDAHLCPPACAGSALTLWWTKPSARASLACSTRYDPAFSNTRGSLVQLKKIDAAADRPSFVPVADQSVRCVSLCVSGSQISFHGLARSPKVIKYLQQKRCFVPLLATLSPSLTPPMHPEDKAAAAGASTAASGM